jgi:hypothetical protein
MLHPYLSNYRHWIYGQRVEQSAIRLMSGCEAACQTEMGLPMYGTRMLEHPKSSLRKGIPECYAQ